jgi:hypothetical protein
VIDLSDLPLGYRLGTIARFTARRVTEIAGYERHAEILLAVAVMLETAGDRRDRLAFALDVGEMQFRSAGLPECVDLIDPLREALERAR